MLIQTKANALKTFLNAIKVLRDENILINNKDFTCQIGEWLVEMLYDGRRAKSGIQKGWDVDVNGKHIQVKAHAKAEGNNNRWSKVDRDSTERIDELIVVVFTHDYKLKEIFVVPWQDAVTHINLSGKKQPRNQLNWSAIKNFRIEKENLPHQEIVSLFK